MRKTPTKRNNNSKIKDSNKTSTSKQIFLTPNISKTKTKQNRTPELTKKRFTDDEFSDLILFDRPKESNLEGMVNSMYQLSLNTIKTETVINIIKEFKELAPLKRYKYESVIDLLTLSSKCPQDIKFLILSIAANGIKGNPPTINDLDIFIEETERLLQKVFEELGKNKTQKELKKELHRMLEIFQYAKRFPIKGTPGDLTTKAIENYIQQEKEKKKRTEKQNQVKNMKEIYSPNLEIDNFLEQEFLENNEKIEGNILDEKLMKYSKSKQEEIRKIIGLFDEWEKAYDATIYIYNKMKKDKDFDLDLILSIIPNTLGDFLVYGLQTFKEEGL